jgi:hypothetical protein
MRSVSQAIFEQLNKMSPPRGNVTARSPGGRFGAAISSARDDPLPTDTSFPAPLPPTTLPYELTLLDNLFLNPVSSHHKLSDYTNGAKHAKLKDTVGIGAFARPQPPLIPAALPPAAFHSFGPYGIAAQVASGAAGSSTQMSLASVAGAWLGTEAGTAAASTVVTGAPSGNGDIMAELQLNGVAGGAGGAGGSNLAANTNGNNAAANGNGTADGAVDPNAAAATANFDIFSFLMDEEGGLSQIGNTNWNALDVPADFPLWS